jgi:hypothetical protein
MRTPRFLAGIHGRAKLLFTKERKAMGGKAWGRV